MNQVATNTLHQLNSILDVNSPAGRIDQNHKSSVMADRKLDMISGIGNYSGHHATQYNNHQSPLHLSPNTASLPRSPFLVNFANNPSHLLDQHYPDLSYSFAPPTSSAVPPIVQPFLISPSYTFPRSNQLVCNHLSTSPIHPILTSESACPSPRLSKFHPDPYHTIPISKPTHQPSPTFPLQPDCFTSSKQPSERSFNTFCNSNHSISRIPPNSKRISLPTLKPGPFDHRRPYLYLDEPFNLENSPELYLPTALVFPCAQQESDPQPPTLPREIQYIHSSEPKMTGPITPVSSNHNLIGHRIDRGRLEFMSVLGLGAYGVVYLARDLTSPDMSYPKLYAVKALNKVGLDARQKSFQRREIALHSLASSHPSIVTLHAVIESPSCIFVILDYCPDGDLFGMITEKQKYLGKTEAIKTVFIQIVDAVQFCHHLGISHRDLKPENILCKKDGTDVVLADFGLATAEKTSSDFGCGSTFYMSPECQGGLFERLSSYSTLHNDIWSLGVILVNLTCGRNPWKQACPSDETFRAYLADPDFLRSILPISKACNSLLKRIFTINPAGRISLEQLKDEILRIDTFNMTPAELSRATRATREAARAWIKDLTGSANPQIQQAHIDFSSWKDVISKKNKPLNSCLVKITEPHSAFRFQTQKKQTPVDSNDLVKFIASSSVSSFDQEKRMDNPTVHQRPRGGPTAGLPRSSIVAPEDPSPRDAPDTPSCDEIVPTGPIEVAFKPIPISKASSTSSNERLRRPRGLSSRLRKFSQAASSFSPSSRLDPQLISSKKLFPKPLSFHRPNAPCPIIVKPHSTISSSPEVPMTPQSQKVKQLAPRTPPPSVSPGRTTFGFIKKPSRFFYPSIHTKQELPPTPSSPNHPTKLVPTSSLSSGFGTSTLSVHRVNKILPRSPLSVNHRENKFLSCYSNQAMDVNLDDELSAEYENQHG